jgi:acetyl-CoA carboxylase alpha subunit
MMLLLPIPSVVVVDGSGGGGDRIEMGVGIGATLLEEPPFFPVFFLLLDRLPTTVPH